MHAPTRSALQLGVVVTFSILLSLTIGLGQLLFDADGENWPDAATDGLPAPLAVPLHILQVVLMAACYVATLAAAIFGTIAVWIDEGPVTAYFDRRHREAERAAEAEREAQAEAERIVADYGKPRTPTVRELEASPRHRDFLDDVTARNADRYGLTHSEYVRAQRLGYVPVDMAARGRERMRLGVPTTYWKAEGE